MRSETEGMTGQRGVEKRRRKLRKIELAVATRTKTGGRPGLQGSSRRSCTGLLRTSMRRRRSKRSVGFQRRKWPRSEGRRTASARRSARRSAGAKKRARLPSAGSKLSLKRRRSRRRRRPCRSRRRKEIATRRTPQTMRREARRRACHCRQSGVLGRPRKSREAGVATPPAVPARHPHAGLRAERPGRRGGRRRLQPPQERIGAVTGLRSRRVDGPGRGRRPGLTRTRSVGRRRAPRHFPQTAQGLHRHCLWSPALSSVSGRRCATRNATRCSQGSQPARQTSLSTA
mmetsp:Transcript_82915/g.231213  ORF Transcript_82915/g.231213 Transcript_82915/m.231213 type:complete len:287 (+) Transcript_82915:754-1614(+)